MKHKILPIILLVLFISGSITAIKAQTVDDRLLRFNDDIAMNTISYIPSAKDLGADGMYMWPNPAKGKTHIYINSLREGDEGQCVLYNMQGKIILFQNFKNGSNEIDFGNVPAGMYVLKLATKNRFLTSKRLVVSQ